MATNSASESTRFAANLDRKFAIIAAVATLHRPNLRDIEKATGIPGISIRRNIMSIRKEFGMDLLFVREAKEPGKNAGIGKHGFYTIQRWGILNQKDFLEKYAKKRKQ